MKNLQIMTFFLFLLLISCKEETNSVFPLTDYDTEMEMEKVSKELNKFEDVLNNLYSESEKKPNEVLLKIDSLLKKNEIEKDKYKSQIKGNIAEDLRMLKAEILYNIGEYNKSINVLEIGTSGNDEVGLICNYVKLKEFEKAKQILDTIPNYTFNTFIYANFYETIGKKNEALKIYQTIEKDRGINHYVYYKLAVERIKELEKIKPILLNSVYYQTGRPSFKRYDSDNPNRTKIFKLIGEIPEVKNLKDWNSTEIFQAPKDNNKNYYWIKVSNSERVKFNFFVYQKSFEIKYYDEKNRKLLSLNEWRKSKEKNGL